MQKKFFQMFLIGSSIAATFSTTSCVGLEIVNDTGEKWIAFTIHVKPKGWAPRTEKINANPGLSQSQAEEWVGFYGGKRDVDKGKSVSVPLPGSWVEALPHEKRSGEVEKPYKFDISLQWWGDLRPPPHVNSLPLGGDWAKDYTTRPLYEYEILRTMEGLVVDVKLEGMSFEDTAEVADTLVKPATHVPIGKADHDDKTEKEGGAAAHPRW